MTDRERLLQILNVPIYPHLDVDPLEAVADYLLDNGVMFGAAVPGHENNYDISEMAYNNGYAKGYEDGSNRKHGRWIRRNHGQVSWVECSECFVCGSPAWVSCPVCDTKMDEKSDNNLLFADMEEIIDATD